MRGKKEFAILRMLAQVRARNVFVCRAAHHRFAATPRYNGGMDSDLQAILARSKIVDVVLAFANAFDRKDWTRLRALLADEIWTDYFELRGESPGNVAADEYVAARRSGLAGLRTLHVSTNHEVQIDVTRASCWSAYQIYRVDPRIADRPNQFYTAGHYEHGLIQSADGAWRIDSIRQTVVTRSGDASVHGAFRMPQR
jgi:hypothetical protein